MNLVVLIAAFLLTACAQDRLVTVTGPQGAAGVDGSAGPQGPQGQDGEDAQYSVSDLVLQSTRLAPDVEVVTGPAVIVMVPAQIFVGVPHTAGSPGWVSLLVGSKTYCYFATTNNASASKIYNLVSIRAGDDTSCTTGAQTNTSYSLLQNVDDGQTIRYSVHTPRVSNTDVVQLVLNKIVF